VIQRIWPGVCQQPAQEASDLNDIALSDAQIDIGNISGFVVGSTTKRHPLFLLQFGDAADMVAVT